MREQLKQLNSSRTLTELLLSSTFINLLSLALPFTMLQIYDRILPNQGYGTASVLVSAVAIAILLELLLRYTRSWLLASSAANFELQTTTEVVDALMKADHSQVEKLGVGRLSNGLASIASMREIYSGQAAVALMDFPFVIIFLALVTYIGGPLVLIPLAVWGVVAVFVFTIGKKLSVATQSLALSDSERSRMLILVLSGLTTAKALAMEARLGSRYSEINYRRLANQQEVDWLSSKLQEVIQGASQATTLLMVLIGCLGVLDGNLTTGGLAACSILAGRAIAPLSAIISLRARLVSAKTAKSHVDELASLPQGRFTGVKRYQQKLPIGPVIFNQVSAKQSGASLEKCDLEIPSGQLVTVTSNPLSHASLLLSAIGAYHAVDFGKIQIAGADIEDHDIDEFKQSVIYLAPWPTLFAGSLMENMTLFRPEREACAKEIAQSLGLTRMIATLPSGYQTQVGGSDSQMLNKGAIKLVGLVRAIVQSPSILLLDEPMLSLDADAQAKTLALLASYRGKMTIVAASHFQSLAESAQHNIVLDEQGAVSKVTNKLEQI